MEPQKKSFWQRLKRLVILLLNWRFLICFGLAWMITNGWSYVMFAMGTVLQSTWMLAVSGAYLTILWFPFSPEKIVTCAIALILVRFLFPKHQKELSAQVREVLKSDKKKKDKKKKGTETDADAPEDPSRKVPLEQKEPTKTQENPQ